MKHISLIIALLFGMLLNACGESEAPQYDVYRVEVNTILNVRERPSKFSNVIDYVDNGELIDVIDMEDGWAKIQSGNGKYGYVSADYLVLVKQKYKPGEDAKSTPPEDNLSAQTNASDRTKGKNDKAAQSQSGNQKSPTSNAESTAKSNVVFMGDSTVLTAADRALIRHKLRPASDYIFIVNTTRKVPTGKLFDYSPDLLDELCRKLDSTMSWWQRIKSWFGGDSPSSNIVLLSYIKDSGLLQGECNGNSLKYLKLSKPEQYFRLQADARTNPVNAIIALGLAIDGAGAEYTTRSWFVRVQINTGNIFDNICEDWIVQNILPRDSFWHKWVLGWIFAWPLGFANWLFVMTGSYLWTLILIMCVLLGINFYGHSGLFRVARVGSENVGCMHQMTIWLVLGISVFLWLSMISMLVYMIPEMSTICVLWESGFSQGVVTRALHTFFSTPLTKHWWMVLMFLIGLVLSLGIVPKYLLNATLPSGLQKRIFSKNKQDIIEELNLNGQSFDEEALERAEYPYVELLSIAVPSEEIGKALAAAIPLSFVFNGSFLLFASIYFWTKTFKKLLVVLAGMISYRKLGYYRK